MKKIIFVTLCILITSFVSIAGNRKADTKSIINTISNYKNVSGVEIVSVGKLGLGLVKSITNLSAESEEEKAVLALLNGVNKLVVVTYEDATEEKRNELNTQLSELFNNVEKVLEFKDEEETVNIYGTSSKNGKSINDLMIFIPKDFTLICALGSIKTEKIADLIKNANE